MPETATPEPRTIGPSAWEYPRLPTPQDMILGTVGGGGGGGGPLPSPTAPPMSGTPSAGTSLTYARGDHRHPSDTSRLALAGGAMSGPLTVLAPTSDGHAATRKYVDDAVQAAAGLSFDFTSALSWTIAHNLNQRIVMAQIVNSAGNTVWADFEYVDPNILRVHFANAVAGTAQIRR